MKEVFRELFGCEPTVEATAPGRVNLIGEHTDYNGGYVLPTAIAQRLRVTLKPRRDQVVRVASFDLDLPTPIFEYNLGQEQRRHRWVDYVEGVTWLLRSKNLPLQGFDALIDSHIPIGAGLSSSAALLVALLRGLKQVFDLPFDDIEIARQSQLIENEFVGAHVGIMDQMASSLADTGTALFLDTRSLRFERIPLPTQQMELFIINSGIKHDHASGDYNQRRRECEEAARLLGVQELRDVAADASLDELPPLLLKRARHVTTENERVLQAVAALRREDVTAMGRLMLASHASMRDDFEVSLPEIDFLVETACYDPSVWGARLTGGGFGGSIVGICRPGEARRVTQEVLRLYQDATGREATILLPPPLPSF